MAEDKYGTRQMTDDQLSAFISEWNENRTHWLAGMQELKRRERGEAKWIARVALGISLASLAMSIIALAS